MQISLEPVGHALGTQKSVEIGLVQVGEQVLDVQRVITGLLKGFHVLFQQRFARYIDVGFADQQIQTSVGQLP